MTTITRLGYCEKCSKEGRPKKGQMFIVYGSTSNKYKGLVSKKSSKIGFVPHIYQIIKIKEDTVFYQKICCMNECGAYIETKDDNTYIHLDETKGIFESTSVANWNALVVFRDIEFVI